MPRFDFEKYDMDFDEEIEFEAQQADEQDIIVGMKTTGCPFAFVIDQVNAFMQ